MAISEIEKSEMIERIFNEMDIENMDKEKIFMFGIGVGRRFEKLSPAPEPYVD